MNAVFKLLDSLWNLKPLKGHRTKIAQAVLFLLPAYQGAATSTELIKAGIDLPNINTVTFIAVTGYFASKVAEFAKEHQTD